MISNEDYAHVMHVFQESGSSVCPTSLHCTGSFNYSKADIFSLVMQVLEAINCVW